VLGLQQAAVWGWTDVRTLGSIAVGAALLVAFVAFELRQATPLVQVRIFAQRAFTVDAVVLILMSAVFVPLFFFASVYAQASLGDSATQAGTLLLVFFGGFALAAQWGGRILDKRGAKPAVVLGPVSTDALNRAPNSNYGEITGITQTARNFGASLGLAVMGSLFISQSVDRVETTLTAKGLPTAEADRIAHAVTSSGAGGDASGFANHAGSGAHAIFEAVQLDIAHSTQTIAWVMAGIMAAAFIVAKLLMPAGRVAEDVEAPETASRAELAPAA
jgi:hypothetical protein